MVKKQGFFARLGSRLRLADDKIVQDERIRDVVIHHVPVGSQGSQNYSGYAQEEYLNALTGRRRADVFDEMRRSDPQVKMCLNAIKNPIRSATFEVEPADSSDEAKADAELIKHILFEDMDRPWKKFVNEALSCVEFGHAVYEVTNKVVLDHPKFGSYNGIRSLGFRSQRTIERWNLNRETGALESVSQMSFGDLQRMVDIPAQHILLVSIDQEGANYEGISLLRPCYGSWFRKNLYLKLNAIGIEKFAVPTPIATIPDGKQNSSEYDLLISALESYTSHEKAYLTIPEGWTLDLKPNAYDPQKVEVSIENEDKRMVKAFLANFLELGMNSVGSYALSNDLSDFFLSGVEYIADELISPINLKLIPDLIKMNRGNRAAYPKIKVSGISDKAGKELGELLKILSDGKFLTPQDADESQIRKRLGLPAFTGEGARSSAPPPAEPSTLAERIKLAEARRIRGKEA